MQKYIICLLSLLLVTLSSCEKPQYEEDEDVETVDDEKPGSWLDDGIDFDNGDQGDPKDSGAAHSGTEDDMMTVDDFINYGPPYQVFVKGYIVGACAQNIKNAEFEPPFTRTSAILLADKKGETLPEKLMSVELRAGKLREKFNLSDNPDNLNRLVYFFGSRQTYLGIAGMKKDIGAYGFLD